MARQASVLYSIFAMMVHAVTWEKILVLEVRCNNDQMRNLVTLLESGTPGERVWGIVVVGDPHTPNNSPGSLILHILHYHYHLLLYYLLSTYLSAKQTWKS